MICSFQKERIENFFENRKFDFKSIIGFELPGSRSVTTCARIFQILESFLKNVRGYMADETKIVVEKNLALNIFKNLNGYYFFRDLQEGEEGKWYTNVFFTDNVKKMINIISPRDMKKTLKTAFLSLVFFTIGCTLGWIAWHLFFEPTYRFTLASIPLWYYVIPVVFSLICFLVSFRSLVIHTKKGERFKKKLFENPSWLFHGEVSSSSEYPEQIRIIFEYSSMGEVERDKLKFEYEQMLETAFKIAQKKNWKIGILWNWKRKRNFFQSIQSFFIKTKELFIHVGSFDELVIFIEADDAFIFIKPSKSFISKGSESDLLIINRLCEKGKENLFLPDYTG